MSEAKPYVVTWKGGADSDVDLETCIAVYGPFDTFESAVAWGNTNEDDDPRWHVVMLSKENMRRDADGPFLVVPVLSTI